MSTGSSPWTSSRPGTSSTWSARPAPSSAARTGSRWSAAPLFSASGGRLLVAVAPDDRARFEAALAGHRYAAVGETTAEQRLRVTGLDGKVALDEELGGLKQAWQRTLVELYGG